MSKTVKIIIIVESILILLLGGYLVYDKVIMKKGTDTPTSDENANQVVSLDVNSNQVTTLYNMYKVYNDTKATFDILSQTDEGKEEMFGSVLVVIPNKNTYDNTNRKYKDYSDAYKIETYSKSDVLKYFRQVYGKELPDSFLSGNTIFKDAVYRCNYKKSSEFGNELFVCYEFPTGGEQYYKYNSILKAEQKNDEIYIYDNEASASCDECTSDNEWEIRVAGKVVLTNVKLTDYFTKSSDGKLTPKDTMTSKLVTYKHTYKKNTDNTYYWYSSEPVTK